VVDPGQPRFTNPRPAIDAAYLPGGTGIVSTRRWGLVGEPALADDQTGEERLLPVVKVVGRLGRPALDTQAHGVMPGAYGR
jgi:hypothetical protein